MLFRFQIYINKDLMAMKKLKCSSPLKKKGGETLSTTTYCIKITPKGSWGGRRGEEERMMQYKHLW